MELNKKIVNFNKWCSKCVNKDCREDDYDSPCAECLEYSYNFGTDKPQLYEELNKEDDAK